MTTATVDTARVRAWRWHAHHLDAAPGSVHEVAHLDVLDLGAQETGPIGALWSLVCRGWTVPDDPEADLFWAWTLRGAPHAYRRSDISQVAAATAPYDEDDAAARIFDAAAPLRRHGIQVLSELANIASLERDVVQEPMGKSAVSTALTERLEEYSVRRCVPCQATHAWELPFRLSALQAGLELAPGTSPPVLRRIPGIRPQRFTERRRPGRFDPARAYLCFFGPASDREVAAHLDGDVASVHRRLRRGTVEVQVDGLPGRRRMLKADAERLVAGGSWTESTGVTRLLGPFDPYLLLRDREVLVGDKQRRQQVWRSLGRPGAIAVDGDIVGTWRPKSSGRRLTVRLEWWSPAGSSLRAGVEQEAERLAAHRGQALEAVTHE